MKTSRFLLIFGAMTLFSCSTAIDVNLGLIAYFSFNETLSNSKNANQLIKKNNVELTIDRFGNKNSACLFNGENSSILIEASNLPAIESAKTISWWYLAQSKPSHNIENSAENMVVLVDTISSIGIQFGFRSEWYKTKGFDSWEWGGGKVLEIDYPEFGIWHHCTYTFSGTTHTFFIDGKRTASSQVELKKGIPNQLMFGNYPGGPQFFKGKIDEVRIYDRVLNNSEIAFLFKQSL